MMYFHVPAKSWRASGHSTTDKKAIIVAKGGVMKKINATLLVEVGGVACVTTGLAILSIPAALIVLGSFLVWITEKGN